MTDWQDRIQGKPDVCNGKLCIRGTRILVSVILDNLAEGRSPDEIVAEYPPLTREDVQAVLAYAAGLAKNPFLGDEVARLEPSVLATMDFHKRACLKRARARIAEASPEALRYACLELRFCIESICYDKLRLYAKHIPPEVLSTWQPRRVVETLREYDPHANSNYTFTKWRNDQNGNPIKRSFTGHHVALSGAVLNKHYNKLGGFLHVPTPAQEQKGMPSPNSPW